MTTEVGGPERFRGELDPRVAAEIAGWAGHPELAKLHASLRAATDGGRFLNTLAEAVIARSLLARGCGLRVEVLTPSGRSCDFEVSAAGRRFFLHVKRLNASRPAQRRLTISSRLRYLERINRPYVVGVRFPEEGLTDEQAGRFVTAAAEFIRHARVGDELPVRDADGTPLGGCRILAPGQDRHVTLVIGLPEGLGSAAPRVWRLLRKAYRQFMPGAVNVILIASPGPEDGDDVATALLGSLIERWDAIPPRGQRVAHGRDTDGFWHEGRAVESQAAGWFAFDAAGDAMEHRLWVRPNSTLDPSMESVLRDLFDGSNGVRRMPGSTGQLR